MKNIIILGISLLIATQTATGQDSISMEDYTSAVGFMGENLTNKKAFNLHIRANWFPDSCGVWYIHHGPVAKKYLQVSLPDKKKSGGITL